MKHNFLTILMCIGICSFGVICCKKKSISESDYTLKEDAIDLTYGMNVIIFSYSDYEKGVKIAIDGDVEAYGTNEDVEYIFDRRPNGQYLVPILESNSADTLIYDEVRLVVDDHRNISKDITIVIRNSDTLDASMDEVKKRMTEVLGWGVNIADPLGTIKECCMFDPKTLLQTEVKEHKTIYNVSTSLQTMEKYNMGGTSFKSITKSMAVDVGLDLNIPLKSDWTISPGVSFEYRKNSRTDKSFEYYYAYDKARKAEGTLNMDALAGKSITAYLNKTINDILNNPGSDAYKLYPPEDTTKTYELLDKYGSHFITACQLGGESMYQFSAKKDFSDKSITWSLAAQLALNSFDKSATDDLLTFLAQCIAPQVASLKASGKDHCRNVVSTSDFKTYKVSYGGTTEGDKWKVTDNPSAWVPVSYAKATTVEAMRNGGLSSNPDMHFIYELCAKDTGGKESARYSSLKKALTPDSKTGFIPYYEHAKLYEYSRPMRVVVADVFNTVHSGNFTPQKGDDNLLWKASPYDQKIRRYYPMIKNQNAQFHPWYRGYACDVNCSYFHGSSSKSRMYVWYALDWSRDGDGVGITDFRIDTKNTVGTQEYARGEKTDAWIDGDPKNGQYFIILKYADKSTKLSEKITGVGLYYTKWDGDNGNERGLVFASSGGTEWDPAIDFKKSGTKEYFDSYWGPNADNSYRLFNETRDSHRQGSWVQIKGNKRPHTMNVCYTRKPIERDMSGYGNEDIISKDPVKKSPICEYKRYGVNSADITPEEYEQEEEKWMQEGEEDETK